MQTKRLLRSAVFAFLPLLALRADATTYYWLGTGGDELASNGANWSLTSGGEPANAAPDDSSDIVVDANSGGQPMTWDLDVKVASWTQTGASVVTFLTGAYGLDSCPVHGELDKDGESHFLHVLGDVSLTAGSWTVPTQKNDSKACPYGSAGYDSKKGVYRLLVKTDGAFTLGADAKLDLQERGFYNFTSWGPFGESHGGAGCLGDTTFSNKPRVKPYGSIFEPVELGTASGYGNGAAGGGAVRLIVGGALTLDGVVDASAKQFATPTYTGNSAPGGSVWLTVGSLSGSGSILCDGAGVNTWYVVGSGGRIAVNLTGDGDFSSFIGTMQALPGASGMAACGTVYMETKAQGAEGAHKGVLKLAGRGAHPLRYYTTEIFEPGEYEFERIDISNGASLGICSNVTVKAGTIVGDGATSSISLLGGKLILPVDAELVNCQARVLADGSEIEGPTADGKDVVTIGDGGVLVVDSPLTLAGDLHVKSGGVVKHTKNASWNNGGSTLEPDSSRYLNSGNWPNSERYVKLELTVAGDMTVDAGGTVDAIEAGVNPAQAPHYEANKAGCYGGITPKAGSADRCFGSFRQPTDFGGAGVNMRSGGAIHLTVGGTLTVNGTVSAGMKEYGWTGGFHSSGGSVWIEAGKLLGSGRIAADGGKSESGTVNGTGGRVALWLTDAGSSSDDFEGTVDVRGCRNNKLEPNNSSGTIFWHLADGSEWLTTDNDGQPTEIGISAEMTDTIVRDVRLPANATLVIGQGATLTVRGDFTNAGALRAETGDADHAAGEIAFADASLVSTVSGVNAYQLLTCTTPGKTIRFAPGDDSEQRIEAGGKLTVLGDETGKVLLRSTVDGQQWRLNVVSGAASEVAFADVRDSDAQSLGGLALSAADSTDSGNNLNWTFSQIVVGETITWTGAAGDGSWASPGNWDLGRPPVDTDVIVISPSEGGTYPTLGETLTFNTLTVAAGATLNLAGYSINVTNSLCVAGTLVCAGNERIACSGEVDFADGAFTPANSTLALVGGLDQAVDFGGLSFNKIELSKSDGDVTFVSGVTAKDFTATATTFEKVVFAAGETYSFEAFTVQGALSGSPGFTFRSSAPGTAWKLEVKRLALVSGVDVADSDASASVQKIFDDAPAANAGGNVNWHFNGKTIRWIGAADGDFAEPSNWSDGIGPTADAQILLDADASFVLNADCSVRAILATGGTSLFQPGTARLTATETLTVASGATVSLNVPCTVGLGVSIESGGVLTHEATTKAAPALTNRLDLTVLGDMTVFAGGKVDVSEKGFVDKAKSEGNGLPGSAYASIGSNSGNNKGRTYGSVVAPTDPGTASGNSNENAGGGILRLDVHGTLTVDGEIRADGRRGPYGPTGGSIWITAGQLVGADTGLIQAAYSAQSYDGTGSGGRISICLSEGTFDTFLGAIRASGTTSADSTYSPGTVYLEPAGVPQYGGTLIVDGGYLANNSTATNRYVELPALCRGDDPSVFKDMTIVLRNNGSIRLTQDLTVEDVVIEAKKSTRPTIDVGDHVLTIRSRTHRRGRGWGVEGVDYGVVRGTGDVVWKEPGLCIIVR